MHIFFVKTTLIVCEYFRNKQKYVSPEALNTWYFWCRKTIHILALGKCYIQKISGCEPVFTRQWYTGRQQNFQIVQKCHNSNAVFDDFHRAKRISINFAAEVGYTIDTSRKGDYLLQFISDIVNDYIKSPNDLEDSYVIPSNLFKE